MLADAANLNVAEVGALITSVMFVDAVRLPEVPVIVRGKLPPAVPGGTHRTNTVEEVELVGENA